MKVLFFSPFANIWEHAFPEALIAGGFAERGAEVTAVRCGTMLQSYCIAMSAAGVPHTAPLKVKQQVCRACIKRRDLITDKMDFPAIVMDEQLLPEDLERTEAIIAAADPATWTEIEVDGVPLGRYAVYEFWLNNKLVSTDLSAVLWPQYLDQLRNTLMVYFVGRRIVAQARPDAVVVYNDHYSVNHAFVAAAQQEGVATYTMHGGQHMIRRAESMTLSKSNHTNVETFRSPAWQHYRSHPIPAEEIRFVGDHFSGLLAASSAFVYSSKFEGTTASDLRSRLGVPPGVPVLLAAMSSEDELMGVRLIDAIPPTIEEQSLFTDQFEWVEYLFEYAREHPDRHLVLRLHPRMFPNKREQVMSPVVTGILALREQAPPNVTFNLPSDGIGLYDLMQIVDVLLNFRSSVGAELAAMGIPVVVPSNADFFTYPHDLHRVGHTRQEYGDRIGEALADGWSLDHSRAAFRWFSFFFSRVAVDLSDAVRSQPVAIRPTKPGLALTLYSRLVYLALQHGPLVRERRALRSRAVAPLSQDILLDVVRSGLPSAADSELWPPGSATPGEETAALQEYLLGLCDGLWAGITEPDSLAGRIRAHLRPPGSPQALFESATNSS